MSFRRERIEALLVDEATGKLSAEERRELKELLRESPGVDRYAFERAAAAVFLSGLAAPAKLMPDDLSARIIAAGEQAVNEKGRERE
ncbi:MAG: hypothetical protein PVH89_03660 [Gammaproteobacteria bacterium]|jgi:hypothetical protein